MAQMENIINEEREFHLYFDFSHEIRKVVIDEMQADDRCRFTRCSKQSNTEAQLSENFVYDLTFIMYSDLARVIVGFLDEYEIGEFRGYELVFEKINGKMIKQYQCHNPQKSWEIELEGPKNVCEHGIEEFKKLVETHQKAIRRLEISDTAFQNNLRDVNFEITNMKNLRRFFIRGHVNMQQYLSKLKRPLQQLWTVTGDDELHDQTYQVTHSLTLDYRNITKEQFWRFKAKEINVAMGQLTEKDVFQFIRSWQDGSIGREIDFCQWGLINPMFDKRKLLRWLRITADNLESGFAEIKHYNETGKSAMLLWFDRNLHLQIADRP